MLVKNPYRVSYNVVIDVYCNICVWSVECVDVLFFFFDIYSDFTIGRATERKRGTSSCLFSIRYHYYSSYFVWYK